MPIRRYGTPDYAERDLDRYHKATADGLRAVAEQWLRPDARMVLRVVPKAKKETKREPHRELGYAKKGHAWRSPPRACGALGARGKLGG